ncbi:MAG: hypothetical protein GX285_01320 [Clostridiales bacterium]|nr:hypothetical protein [Clostridiales bacterium]
MLYILLIIGIIIFIYGFYKSRQSGKDFEQFYSQASQQELHLVNHTIDEENIKKDLENLQREMDVLKKFVYSNISVSNSKMASETDNKNKTKNMASDNELLQKFISSEDDTSLEQLSKETGIGKGELLLLKKLSRK